MMQKHLCYALWNLKVCTTVQLNLSIPLSGLRLTRIWQLCASHNTDATKPWLLVNKLPTTCRLTKKKVQIVRRLNCAISFGRCCSPMTAISYRLTKSTKRFSTRSGKAAISRCTAILLCLISNISLVGIMTRGQCLISSVWVGD